MIASTSAMAAHAREHGYAVPAVNVLDDISLRAVVAAAVEASAPLIVQISVKTVKQLGTELTTTTFRLAAQDAPIPVALHLDHCPDRAVISDVVAAGWSSVLFDASDRDLADAERETGEVVAQAHAAGVDVESEIENIVGVEDGVGSDVALHAYSVQQLADVAGRTGVDLLAPQLGTAHGRYKARPVLRPDRVRELAALTDLPIVGDVRGAGYFYGIELVKDKASRETFDDDESERLLRGFLSGRLFEAGLVCRADDRGDPVIQLAPPLICGPEQFDEIERILREVLTEAWQRI